jgi:DNA-binding response OmpR family regulator
MPTEVFTLLVAAEPDWTDHLKKTLFAREGRRIVTALNVAETQQKARFAPPDLVVMKARLPDGTAGELCRFFRTSSDLKNSRLVVMVDADTPGDAAAAREAGADQIIVKPASPEALTPLIAQIMDAPLRQEIRVPVEVRIEGETDRGTLHGLTRNLSLGGALVEVSATKLHSGDKLYLRLHPHGASSPIVAKAEVMRVTPQPTGLSLGVRFVRFDKDGRERLEKFLETRDAV